jgi:hypothetical protein
MLLDSSTVWATITTIFQNGSKSCNIISRALYSNFIILKAIIDYSLLNQTTKQFEMQITNVVSLFTTNSFNGF